MLFTHQFFHAFTDAGNVHGKVLQAFGDSAKYHFSSGLFRSHTVFLAVSEEKSSWPMHIDLLGKLSAFYALLQGPSFVRHRQLIQRPSVPHDSQFVCRQRGI